MKPKKSVRAEVDQRRDLEKEHRVLEVWVPTILGVPFHPWSNPGTPCAAIFASYFYLQKINQFQIVAI